MNLVIHTDGGARGNPGEAAVGVVIEQIANSKSQAVKSFGKRIGIKTNNEAEYQGVIHALEEVKSQKSKVKSIEFYLDSLLVCNQIKGLFKVKQAHLQELLLQVRMLEQEIGASYHYHHVPREKNKEADALVNQAFDG